MPEKCCDLIYKRDSLKKKIMNNENKRHLSIKGCLPHLQHDILSKRKSFSVCHSEMPKHSKTSAKLLKLALNLFRKHLASFYSFTTNLTLLTSLFFVSFFTFLKAK